MDCLWSTGVQGGAQRGVGGGGKLMRADGKGKKGQEKRKERENREKFFLAPTLPTLAFRL